MSLAFMTKLDNRGKETILSFFHYSKALFILRSSHQFCSCRLLSRSRNPRPIHEQPHTALTDLHKLDLALTFHLDLPSLRKAMSPERQVLLATWGRLHAEGSPPLIHGTFLRVTCERLLDRMSKSHTSIL